MFSFFGASSAQIRRYVSVIFYYVTVQYYQSNINHQIKSHYSIYISSLVQRPPQEYPVTTTVHLNPFLSTAPKPTTTRTTMMRSFLSTLIVSIFCSKLGYAYISQSSSGTGWRRHDNANAGAEKSFKQPPANIKIDDIFREEYHEWCKRYGRSVGDGIRFENFKLNFMLQMQQNKRSGTFNLLNEFGDITAREFNEIVKGKITNNDEKDTSSATATNTSSSSSSPPRKKSSGVAVIAELIIEPIPKVSILGPSNLSTLKDKSRNYNNLSGRNNSGESYQQRAAPRYSSAAGPVVRPTLQRSTVDQATSDNNNINSNNSRSHRKVGPDQAPNNNRNNNGSSPSMYVGGLDQDTGPSPRRERRTIRWVGPDKIL